MKKGVGKITFGVILFMAGIAVSLGFMAPVFLAFLNEKNPTFRSPGSIEITIDEPGRYVLWNNYQTVYDGRSYSSDQTLPDGLTFTLVDQETGETVPMKKDLSTSVQSGDERKSSVGSYDLETPGKYVLSVSGGDQERIFSFGKSIFSNFWQVMGLIIAGVLVGLVAGLGSLIFIVLGLVDLVRPSKSSKTGSA